MPLSLKRMHKEIELFNNKINFDKYNSNIQNFFYSLIMIEYNIDNNTYLDVKNNNNILLLTLKLPPDYPFKPYEIIYNNITNKLNKNNSYFRNIGLLSEKKIFDEKILNFFYKIQYGLNSKFLNLQINNCFCCKSLFYNYNWNPYLTIIDILLEYLEIKFIVKYSRPYNYLNVLNIYNNLYTINSNKLPNEILDNIFNSL
tara:strand:+ start:9669 stop:10268 length:600 start_codon:yes stop_codon:yes gene_type:complete